MFAAIAFISYGMFWIVLVSLLILPKTGVAAAADEMAMGFFMLIWGLFSTVMFVGTLKFAPLALQFVFATVAPLFYLLAIHFFTGSLGVQTAAGVVGIICGGSALYMAFAEILNHVYGKTILPLDIPKCVFSKCAKA